MKNQTSILLSDILRKGWRGAAVASLVALCVFSTMIEWRFLSGTVLGLLWLVSSLAIWFIIAQDSPRKMQSTKSAVYVTLVVGTLWVSTLIEMLWRLGHGHPLMTYQVKRFADDSISAASLQLAPIIPATFIAVTFLASGLIAYHIGKQRKDIKGIKKQDLFK